MDWTNRIVLVPCASPGCNTSVRVTTQQQSDAIIALGKTPYCERCFKSRRPAGSLAPVRFLEW